MKISTYFSGWWVHAPRAFATSGVQVAESTLRRFWTMPAHSHGQVLNSSTLARSLGADRRIGQNHPELCGHPREHLHALRAFSLV